MNAKQKAFALEYLKDLNATQAAVRAGFGVKTARQQGARLLSNAAIQAAVAEGMTAREKRTAIDADYILTAAKEVLERCLCRVPVMVREGRTMVQKKAEGDNGEVLGVWEFDSAGANGALKLMASHVHGFHAPTKAELTGKDGGPLTVNIVSFKAAK